MTGSPRPTINDVASSAGVSRQTVSRVLNGGIWVAEETRTRVLSAIQTLGYRRNTLAGSMRSGSTRTLGLLVADIVIPMFALEVRGVQDVADAADYQVILGSTDENPGQEERLLRLLREKQVDGALVIPTRRRTHHLLHELVQDGLRVVALNRSLPGLPGVSFDYAASTRRAVEHLLGQGIERVGLLVRGDPGSPTGDAHVRGYRAALAAAGIDRDDRLIRATASAGHMEVESAGYRATVDLLAVTPAPRAVVVTSSTLTVGALRALRDGEVRIPADLAIVAYNADPWGQVTQPPLSTVTVDAYRLGKVGTELLLAQISGDQHTHPTRVQLLPELIVRESSQLPG